MKDTNFYRALEDKYRGPRDLIKSRLRVYLPFVLPLLKYYSKGPAVDIGCGRGEWLELLQENGFEGSGWDLDEGMLSAVEKTGLKVELGDGIAALKGYADESFAVVSAFHVVEHIPFDVLVVFVKEAFRVLKPGGIFILETPNSENIAVGTSLFFFDPTHVKPIPSELLAFLTEYNGFKRVKTLRLQESPDINTPRGIGVIHVLAGVSPDYAIVAQKKGPEDLLTQTSTAFGAVRGVGMSELAVRYDQQITLAFSQMERRLKDAEAIIDRLQDSWFWRLTNNSTLSKLSSWSGASKRTSWLGLVKILLKKALKLCKFFLLKFPVLKNLVRFVLLPFPKLKAKLALATRSGEPGKLYSSPIKFDPQNISENARQIAKDLKREANNGRRDRS